MAVEDQETTRTGTLDPSAEGNPARGQHCRVDGERPRQRPMFDRPADGLQRQGDGADSSARLHRRAQDAFEDEGIGAGGKMGSMLFGRTYRQDEHLVVERRSELRRRHLAPLPQHARPLRPAPVLEFCILIAVRLCRRGGAISTCSCFGGGLAKARFGATLLGKAD